MIGRLTMFVVLGCAPLAGCDGARGAPPVMDAAAAAPAREAAPPPAPPASSAQITAPAERRSRRVIEKDPDGDGIADYRVFVTETFDADGLLVERIREEDFEADGIVDDRTVTTFGN